MSKTEFLSTSALAKQLGMSSKELFSKFTKDQLIELNDKDVLNLDDILPRLLLKFGIQSY